MKMQYTIGSHFNDFLKKFIFRPVVFGFSLTLSYLISGSWLQRQCWVCVSPCGMCLKLNQTWVDNITCHHCSIIICRQDRSLAKSFVTMFVGFSHFSFISLLNTFPHQRHWIVKIKSPCRHQVDISIFSWHVGCCPKQCGLVSLQSATLFLGTV